MSGFRIRLLCLIIFINVSRFYIIRKWFYIIRRWIMDSSFGKEGILSRLRLLDEDLDFRFGGARRFDS